MTAPEQAPVDKKKLKVIKKVIPVAQVKEQQDPDSIPLLATVEAVSEVLPAPTKVQRV